MGRGPLRSVLHYDELDNLLCVIDGVKDVILIDQVFSFRCVVAIYGKFVGLICGMLYAFYLCILICR